MQTVNIGILAHVDAGKTSLTERILFQTGVIPAIGSVDHGTTHTDSLDLERERGITIQSAVVSFRIGGLKVNLIDTPGHPDFIAEVERALGVLDGVILVVSSVEGVQSQTRRLMQAITAAGIPVILFANKIDRLGAREGDLVDEIRRALCPGALPLNSVSDIGTRDAGVVPYATTNPRFTDALLDLLTGNDDKLLARYLRDNGSLQPLSLSESLVSQARRGLVSPLYFGSAMTGAGVDHLLAGVARFLPVSAGRPDAPLSGTAFKIQRAKSGEKMVYARLFSGSIERRQHVALRRSGDDAEYGARITGIDLFADGRIEAATTAVAGDIVRLHGLKDARIGDAIGQDPVGRKRPAFSPPVLESVVRPIDPRLRTRLNSALADLADQDPLISIRRDNRRGGVSVRLYGEVQKEVIAATLANEFGVDAEFEPSHIICVERPAGTGYAVEHIGVAPNPFAAGMGLRIEPGPEGSGITYHRELGSLPPSFYVAIEETVYATLEEGLSGWQVVDGAITLTDVAYWSPVSVAGDFRKLTPLVLMEALRRAGTQVCEPIERFTLEVPVDCLGEALNALGAARGIARQTDMRENSWRVTGTIPASEVHGFEQRLPGVSRGSGEFSSRFDSFAPVTGKVPDRARTDFNPLNRKYYLAQVSQA